MKSKGYNPDYILDIGAYHGEWTKSMINIFQNSKYYLFEPNNHKELDLFRNNENTFVYNVLLNDKIKIVECFSNGTTGDSFFKENTTFYNNIDSIKKETISLDKIIDRDNILQNAKNIFIKIDCQGAEIPILKGSDKILEKTDFILIEMPFFGKYNKNVPNFLEHIQFMDNIGFIPFDIIDTHHCNNFKIQIDMLFINKNHQFNKEVIH